MSSATATATRRRMSVPHLSSLALTSSSSSSSSPSVFSSQRSSSSSQTTDSACSPPDSPKPGLSSSAQPCVARLVDSLELEPEKTPRVQQAAQVGPPEEDPDGGYESERELEGPLVGGMKNRNRPKILTRKRGVSSAAAVSAAWTEGIIEKTVRSRLHLLLFLHESQPPPVLAAHPSFTSEAPTRWNQQQQRHRRRRLPSQTPAFTPLWYGLAFSYLSSPLRALVFLHSPVLSISLWSVSSSKRTPRWFRRAVRSYRYRERRNPAGDAG